MLDLTHVLDRAVEHLSGGELQRFAIAVVCVQEADMSACVRREKKEKDGDCYVLC